MLFVFYLLCFVTLCKASRRAYRCDNGELIRFAERCDGETSCYDGSDEQDCDYDFWNKSTESYSTTEVMFPLENKCNISDAFHCDNDSCIFLEKHCDGYKDCENGQDEKNCGFDSLTAKYLNNVRTKALQWIKNQYNAEWGWNKNTHRAVVALYLAGGASFNGSSKDDDLIEKQLELEVATYLLRREHEKISSTDLAAYINALLVICHDPRNFFGYDLISFLKEDLENNSSFVPPSIYLTLCNAKEPISEESVITLLNILKNDSLTHGFVVEIQALATMALSCIFSNGTANKYLNVTAAVNNLKNHQMENGSFGNVYTTALVLQALIANNKGITEDWVKSSIDFLSRAQKPDGSFGNFLSTYLILPVLNAKTLLDVGKVNCNFKRQRGVNITMDMKHHFGKKIFVKYSLFVGDEKENRYSVMFRAPENITVLDLMTLAADLNPKYQFKIHEVRKKNYIYEISYIPNDPEHNKFWFVYQGVGNNTVPILEQSPDKINVHTNDDIIMWYKTLDSL